ncbi:MAG TPA: sugar nucleotide-binding protein, partial [Saprospiraceae bacterium]|nr:sugar nucleotide-binding protein [Saprospiraceae bacterium]
AYRYNADAAGYIAKACKAKGVHLLHFSSDYVYDNGLQRPLLESDPTEPKSIYAKSKLAGEHLIQKSGCQYTIIRTSWVYGPGGHNFVNTMLRLGKMKSQLTIVGDQVGAPTLTTDIALACKDLIQFQDNHQPAAIQGIFNYANAGEVTWDNFARAIFKHTRIPCEVVTITTREYGAPAPRPAYSVLNCDKIKSFLAAPIPTWEDALSRYLDKTNSEAYEL